jgi:hypothetical protein
MPKRQLTHAEWFAEKVPDAWLGGPPVVTVDTEEIVVVLPLPDGAGDVRAFRGATKDQRMAIAAEAQDLFGRTVSWGVQCDGTVHLFTHLAVPAMTRLRQPERRVLDTLVAAGAARSRSDALAWCVRHVAETEGEWLAQLRDALQAVDEVRREGPARAKGTPSA